MRDSGGDQTVEPPELAAPARSNGKPVHRNRRRISAGFAVSLALHAAVLTALLLRLKWEKEPEPLPPPATVTMVFEGGHPEQPSTPEPVPVPSNQNPAPVGGPKGGAPLSPPPEVPPPPQVQPAPPETPPPVTEPVPPQQETPPPPPPPEQIPPPVEPPPPSPPIPPSEPGPSEIIVPPPSVPVPASPPIERPPPPPPAPRHETWPPLRPPSQAQRPSDFPPPMDYSFGPPSTPGALTPGKPLLSLGLPRRGPEDSTPYSLDTDAEVGPDWRNALSEWVNEHAYYPSQAAQLRQEGAVRVLVTTMPNGRVLSVEMEKRSGSPWLDLALEGMFRGAKLPPMPRSVGNEPVGFHFTMHYIIVR